MPPLSRVLIRTAIAYLVASLCLGAVAEGYDWAHAATSRGLWMPSYLHLFFLGWVSQLIFGVAHWMFPKPLFPSLPVLEAVGWVSFAVWNLGLVLRTVAEPLLVAGSGGPWAVVLLVAAALHGIGALGWAVLLWPRIRGR